MPKKLSREQILRKERRLVRVPVDVALIAKYLLRPKEGYRLELAKSVIPHDAIFITAYYSMESYNCFFVFAHQLFDEVPEGEALPIIDTVITEVGAQDSDEDDY